jgi:hypothetical protein
MRLSPSNRIIIDAFKHAGGQLSRSQLLLRASEAGMSEYMIGMKLQFAPYLDRAGPGLYALRGIWRRRGGRRQGTKAV